MRGTGRLERPSQASLRACTTSCLNRPSATSVLVAKPDVLKHSASACQRRGACRCSLFGSMHARCFRGALPGEPPHRYAPRSEEHTSELQSLMRISYAVFCLKKKIKTKIRNIPT